MSRVFLIVFLVLSTSSYFAFSQEAGLITGRTLDTKGNPLEWVSVYLDQIAVGDQTDCTGTYEIIVEPGIYTLIANMVGRSEKKIPDIEVFAGDTTVVDFDSLYRVYPEYSTMRHHRDYKY